MSLGTSGTLFTCADHPVVDDAGGLGRVLFLHRRLAAADLHDELHGRHRSVARAFGFSTPRRRCGAGRHARPAPTAWACCRSSTASARRTCRRRAAASSACTWTTSRAAMPTAPRWKAPPTRCAMASTRCGRAGLDFDAIRLTGGGSKSAAWRQMVADVFESAGGSARASRGRGVRRGAAGAVGLPRPPAAPPTWPTSRASTCRWMPRAAPIPTRRPSAAYSAAYRQFLRQLRAPPNRYIRRHSYRT